MIEHDLQVGQEIAIRVSELKVAYGDVLAVDGLDLEVRSGEILGFLGPNGAGKTTTIRALLDLLRPAGGIVEVLGEDVRTRSKSLFQRIGFLPGDLALFPHLSGLETLDFLNRLNGRSPRRREEVLARLEFPRAALDRKIRTYSTGMRQKIGMTASLQHAPELLILDEPTSGLDPIVRDAFLELLREHAGEGGTVFFSSHVLAEVEECADRIALIHQGRLHLVDEVTAVRQRFPRQVRLVHRDGRRESFAHSGSPRELVEKLRGQDLLDLEVRPADLAEVFRSIVRGGDGK